MKKRSLKKLEINKITITDMFSQTGGLERENKIYTSNHPVSCLSIDFTCQKN